MYKSNKNKLTFVDKVLSQMIIRRSYRVPCFSDIKTTDFLFRDTAVAFGVILLTLFFAYPFRYCHFDRSILIPD